MLRPSDPHTIWEQDTKPHRRDEREDHQHFQDSLDRLFEMCPPDEWDETLARRVLEHRSFPPVELARAA